MYNHTLHRKYCCCYCLQPFSTEEVLKCHIKDCFKLNSKQNVIMPKKGEYVRLKNYKRKIKSSLIMNADFESILVPENNRKQNPEDSYTNKYKKHIAFSYGHKLVCVNDRFSKPHKTYLGEDAVYSFINNIIEESKYCSDVKRKHINKELVMTKEGNENFKNSTKCWVCDNDYIYNDVKVIDHCHIT